MLYIYILNSIPAFFLDQPWAQTVAYTLPTESPDGFHGGISQSLIYGVIFVLLDAAFIMAYATLALRAASSRLGRRFDVNKLSAAGLFGVGALLIIKGYRELKPA